ncbi:MAG TPA: hypothetical protein DD706_18205 [Nitrospiraceae bacterium]|nr:hypothetical protein [Nitrospiraceae bacterium]
MQKNVPILAVPVKPSREKNFVPKIAHLLNLRKVANANAAIQDVKKEMSRKDGCSRRRRPPH